MSDLALVLALLAFGITCFLGGACFGVTECTADLEARNPTNEAEVQEVTRDLKIRKAS